MANTDIKKTKQSKELNKISKDAFYSEVLILIQKYQLGKKDKFFPKRKTLFFLAIEDLNELILNIRSLSLLLDIEDKEKEEISSKVILSLHENIFNNYNNSLLFNNNVEDLEQFKLDYNKFKEELEEIIKFSIFSNEKRNDTIY